MNVEQYQLLTTSSLCVVKLNYHHSYISILYNDLKPSRLCQTGLVFAL